MDTDEIRGTIDRRLLRISQEKNVSSFHSFINSILRELKIRIETPIEPNKELMVCGTNGYYIIIILWFYIQKLLSLNYISLVETATNSNNYEAGEDETFDNKQDKVYLPKNISDYLKKSNEKQHSCIPRFR